MHIRNPHTHRTQHRHRPYRLTILQRTRRRPSTVPHRYRTKTMALSQVPCTLRVPRHMMRGLRYYTVTHNCTPLVIQPNISLKCLPCRQPHRLRSPHHTPPQARTQTPHRTLIHTPLKPRHILVPLGTIADRQATTREARTHTRHPMIRRWPTYAINAPHKHLVLASVPFDTILKVGRCLAFLQVRNPTQTPMVASLPMVWTAS